MANADNCRLLSCNFLRQAGAVYTADGTESGWYVEDCFDGDPSTYWTGTGPNAPGVITIDCGATLSATPDYFWIKSNLDNFTVARSSDNSVWTDVYTINSNSAAANFCALSGSAANRYWRLTVTSVQSAAVPVVYGLGLYDAIYQFEDESNPLFSAVPFEAGDEFVNYQGGIYKGKVAEKHSISLEIEYLVASGFATVRDSWWRPYRTSCAVYPEPTTYPGEMYDCVCAELNLGYAHKYKGLGYAGTIEMRSI